jgi:hypothetical protein
MLLLEEELVTFAVTPAIVDKNTCAGSGNEKNPTINTTKNFPAFFIINRIIPN